MLQETEIKLSLNERTMALLFSHRLIKQHLVNHWQTVPLYNQYYDTPSLALDQADMALRLRRDGEEIIQTFKERGTSVGGVSVRNEWDWYLDDYKLALELLDEDCWPTSLSELDKSTIAPIFTTHFERTKAMLEWCWRGQKVAVEIALDKGLVATEHAQGIICELELEIREGPLEALMELVVDLAIDLPLFPISTSKAERGYQLLSRSRQHKPVQPLKPHDTNIRLGEAVAVVIEALIEGILLKTSAISVMQPRNLLKDIQQQLLVVRSLLSCYGVTLFSNDYKAVMSSLNEIEADIEFILSSDLTEIPLAQHTQGCLVKPAWGYLFLRLSKWCILKEWERSD